MNMNDRSTLMALVVAVTVVSAPPGLHPSLAQDMIARLPANVTEVLALPPDSLSQFVQSLTADELAAILSTAMPDQQRALITALSSEDRTAVLAGQAQANTDPSPLAGLIADMITADPRTTEQIIAQVRQAMPTTALSPLAKQKTFAIASRCALADQAALTGMVLANTAFDTGAADRLVQFGNTADEVCAVKLARSIANITETADETIATSLEVALALEGGRMGNLVSAMRGEVEVAATPRPPAAPPAGPIIAPAGVGGAGSAPGSTPGSSAGENAIFAQNGQNGGFPGNGQNGGFPGNGGNNPFVGGQNGEDASPTN
ncbi:MAG: hypothetical protein ACK4RZ_04570 [Paracoccaceae bacterium]